MQFFGRLKRSKQGVGSIIGGVFILLILLMGYTFYFLNVNVTEGYNKILQDMGELDLKRNKENLEFISVSFNNDQLNISVKNTGSYDAHLIWLGIFDETVTSNTQEYYEIDFHVDPAETVPDIRNVTIPTFEGQERVVQLVTELGNAFSYSYPPPSVTGIYAYDFVDQEGGPPTVGSHSLFSAQQYGPDGIRDTLTEANTGGTVNTEDFVDGNLSNVDGHAGHGTSSNFTAQQDANIAYNDTLTDDNTSNSTGVLGYSTASTTGSTTIEDQLVGSLFTPTSSGWASNVMAYIGCTTATKASKAAIYRHSDLALIAQTAEITLATGTSWRTYTFTTYPFLVASTGYVLVAWSFLGTGNCLLYYASGTSNQGHIDPNTYGANFADPMVVLSHNAYQYDINASLITPNYEMDCEFNYTVADYSQANEYLCIRTSSYTGTTAENLRVDVWSGGAWVNLIASLTANDWNNVSISSNLTSANIYFRFLGASEASDSSQNTWIIECNLIHYWTDPNCELDLEVQWTNANYDEAYKWLCIYGGTMGSENISVYVWSGTDWIRVLEDLESGWNNADVSSYLTSSTFKVRFRGGTETGGLTEDKWEIDATFLHAWS